VLKDIRRATRRHFSAEDQDQDRAGRPAAKTALRSCVAI
jgi:hypothetical protein